MATGVMCALYERFIAIVTFSALPFAGLPAAIPARREYPPTKPPIAPAIKFPTVLKLSSLIPLPTI